MDDYQLDRARGRADYRNGHPFDPGPHTTNWGYGDGWTTAAEEAEATYGHVLACTLAWTPGGVAAYERRQNAGVTTGETTTEPQP
jgi:hypothetical protein